jgi:hypothetical protein
MITARIEFKPGCGEQFCLTATQDIVEVKFQDLIDLIETVKDFEAYISNCIVRMDGKVFDLKEISEIESRA